MVAKELFESAISQDPAYAPAYVGLADAYSFLSNHSSSIPSSVAEKRAGELVSKALELNPDLPEARASLGLLLALKYDFAAAEMELRRAIALNPGYSDAHNWLGQFVLASLGRYQECLEELKLAELADPASIVVLVNEHTWTLVIARNIEECVRIRERATLLYQEHPLITRMILWFHFVSGNYSRVIELSLKEASEGVEGRDSVVVLMWLVMAYASVGERDEARKWLARIERLPETRFFRSAALAFAHSSLGDVDEFFAWANRSIEEKTMHFGELRIVDSLIPSMGNVRQDPRFVELFKRVGLEG